MKSFFDRLALRGSDRSGQEGQSLIELALLVPILVGILLAAAEVAQLAYQGIEVANAAKAGVEYGARTRTAAADTTGIQTAASNDAANLTGLQTTVSTACTCTNSSYVPTSCSDNTTCSSHSAQMEETLTVQTSATVNTIIHVPGFSNSITLHGQAVQKVLN